MKKGFLTSAALLLAAGAMAQKASAPIYFNQNDGKSRLVQSTDIDSASFSADNTLATFYMDGGESWVRYSLKNGLDSITFSTPAKSQKVTDFPESADFTVAFDKSDDSSYKNVDETVQTNETASDYGDFIENYTASSTVTFTFSGNSVSYTSLPKNVVVKQDGAHVTVVSEKSKMRYVLKGSTTNGSFKIDSGKKFRLELAGVSITNPTGAAINIQSGKAVYLVLNSGTVNTLVDGESYTMVQDEDQKSALFSEGQLLISGSGSLSVTSKSVHGICSDDYIRVRKNAGTITVKAAVDAINTKEHFLMYGGTLDLTGGDDGLTVRGGYLSIMGGKLSVKAVDKALDASYGSNDSTYIEIGGGLTKLVTTGAKGHAIYTTGKFNMTGGILQATVKGAASKALNTYGNTTIQNAKLTLMTEGVPQYNDEESDWSSASGIRCRSMLSVSNSTIGIWSKGAGGKGFNCDADVNLDASKVTVLTTGGSYAQGGENVRPRGVDVASLSISGGTELDICASHAAILAEKDMKMSSGEVNAFTTAASVKIVNVKGSYSQTGGTVLEGR